MNVNICYIIGILEDGAKSLQEKSIILISDADLIIGSPHQLDLVLGLIPANCETFSIVGNLAATPTKVTEALEEDKKVVVLATGDPLCHGVGAYLVKKLGEERIIIHPNLSALQLAAAKLGQRWDTMTIESIHSGQIGEWVSGATPDHGMYPLRQSLEQDGPWGVFTAKGNGPDKIARMLATEAIAEEFELDIFVALGAENEQIFRQQKPAEITETTFKDPNFVVIRRVKSPQNRVLFGRVEEEFALRKPDKGLITKKEVRAVALGLMKLQSNSFVWDVGAGSGSVGLEAASLCQKGHVWSVEKNEKDFANVTANKKNLGLFNYSPFLGKAPVGLENWAKPNAVFIGGSGGNLEDIINYSFEKLQSSGRLVAAFVTLENLTTAQKTLEGLTEDWGIIQIQVARSKPILNMNRFESLQPVWLVWAEKRAESNESALKDITNE
ncbi:MAG: precorrin-6y C5,15-methyltransferase (decarboxylating) subunit CbiE [SAR324 cluster bacterium]|nr:precorrin-6y C5,15-methyltransferase (decarboxylating) subunit CbiE [SAR324 cluster bacterium]